MKIWQKNTDVNKDIDKFTVGQDRALDLEMAALKLIYIEIKSGDFVIEEAVEDVHSQVEWLLTQRIGEAGVLFDLKLS